MKQKIVLAGATGFIGRWIIEEFQDDYQIIGLSRKKVKTNPNDKIIWRTVDCIRCQVQKKLWREQILPFI